MPTPGFYTSLINTKPRYAAGGGAAMQNVAMGSTGDWEAAERQRQFQDEQAGKQMAFQGGQAGAQRQFEGEQAGAQRGFEGQQGAANRDLQFKLGMAPIDFQREKFNAISPLIQGLAGQIGGGGSYSVGGQNTAQAPGTVGGVWTPQQVDQQVNAAKAGNAQQAGTQSRAAAQKTAGQGFGSRSPLLAALQGQIGAAQMGNDATAERGIRWTAAEGNAKQQLASEQAREQQWADYNDADIRRRQTATQGTSSLLAALGGLI